jgi:hypothetical protein
MDPLDRLSVAYVEGCPESLVAIYYRFSGKTQGCCIERSNEPDPKR